METKTSTWLNFPYGWIVAVEQIRGLEEKTNSKRAVLWNAQSGISEWKLSIWVRSFNKSHNRLKS